MTKRTIARGAFKRALLFGALGGALALVDLLVLLPATDATRSRLRVPSDGLQ